MKLPLFNHVNRLEVWDQEGRKLHLDAGHMVIAGTLLAILCLPTGLLWVLSHVNTSHRCCTLELPFCPVEIQCPGIGTDRTQMLWAGREPEGKKAVAQGYQYSITGTAMAKHEAGAKEVKFVCLEYTLILNFLPSLEQLSAHRMVPGLAVYGTKRTS